MLQSLCVADQQSICYQWFRYVHRRQTPRLHFHFGRSLRPALTAMETCMSLSVGIMRKAAATAVRYHTVISVAVATMYRYKCHYIVCMYHYRMQMYPNIEVRVCVNLCTRATFRTAACPISVVYHCVYHFLSTHSDLLHAVLSLRSPPGTHLLVYLDHCCV